MLDTVMEALEDNHIDLNSIDKTSQFWKMMINQES